MKLLYFITEDWFFVSHFLARAKAAVRAGCEVAVVTNINNCQNEIEAAGIQVIPLQLRRKGKNLFEELRLLMNIIKLLKREQPDILHNIAIKPMMYGSFAAWLSGVPHVVNAIVGLGSVFIQTGFWAGVVQKLVSLCYRMAFGITGSLVVFENLDDVSLFLKQGIVKKEQVVLIKGAGVDVNRFTVIPEPQEVPVLTMVSRMLWDKGVGELVEAVMILRKKGVSCRVLLVGEPDPQNPAAIPEEVLRTWHQNGLVEWWGRRDDIPQVLAGTNIVVLPSYREGLPKALLEAAACGRAIVATDVPGCREIVRDGENGLLVPVRDADSLAQAIRYLIEHEDERKQMGICGREMVVAHYSEEQVISETMVVYETMVNQ